MKQSVFPLYYSWVMMALSKCAKINKIYKVLEKKVHKHSLWMLLMVFPLYFTLSWELLWLLTVCFPIHNNYLQLLDNASPFQFLLIASALLPFSLSILAPYCFTCRRISFFPLIQSFRRHCSKTAGSDCEAKTSANFSIFPHLHDGNPLEPSPFGSFGLLNNVSEIVSKKCL